MSSGSSQLKRWVFPELDKTASVAEKDRALV